MCWQPPKGGIKKKPEKRLRFEEVGGLSEVKTQVIGPLLVPSSEMSDSEKRAIWWQDSDYENFTQNTKDISDGIFFREGHNDALRYSSALTETYKACRSVPKFIKKDRVICPATRMKLEEINRGSGHYRGLEYLSVPFLVEAKRRSRESSIKRVLELQTKMNQSNLYDASMKSEFLSKFSVQRTQCARLFARVMGEADAAAVANEKHVDNLASIIASRSA